MIPVIPNDVADLNFDAVSEKVPDVILAPDFFARYATYSCADRNVFVPKTSKQHRFYFIRCQELKSPRKAPVARLAEMVCHARCMKSLNS